MRVPFLFIFTILLINSYTALAKKAKQIQEISGISIDGNLQEWPSPLTNYDKSGGIHYSYSRNNDNLLIAIKSNNNIAKMKMAKSVSIIVDTTCSKKIYNYIQIVLTPTKLPDKIDWQQNLPKNNLVKELPIEPNKARQQGIYDIERIRESLTPKIELIKIAYNGVINIYNAKEIDTEKIKVGIHINENDELIYEISILSKLFLHRPIDLYKKIGLGIFLEGLDESDMMLLQLINNNQSMISPPSGFPNEMSGGLPPMPSGNMLGSRPPMNINEDGGNQMMMFTPAVPDISLESTTSWKTITATKRK